MSETEEKLAINSKAQLTIVRPQLTIAARNAVPIREAGYPFIWIVYSAGQTTRVDVMHDGLSRPYVEERHRLGLEFQV